MIRKIIYADNPQLRERSRSIKRIDADVRRLIDDMVETMHVSNGIGLAAIQVGVPRRIIVVQLPEEYEEDNENLGGNNGKRAHVQLPPEVGQLYAIINPEIVRYSRKMEEGVEGCLSIPGLVGMVPRHTSVIVRGMGLDGKKVRIRANGLLARIFQHEIDHCEGVLFIDHIVDPNKIWSVEEGTEELAEAEQQSPTM